MELPDIAALYVQFRAHYGTEEEPIEEFLKFASAKIAEEKPEHLVLDLRFDGGGDISKTIAFFNGLAAAVPGRIYVIVSRLTFSAGIVAAALVEQSAPERVQIVGEPVGDRLRFWSEGRAVCLPESKYCVKVDGWSLGPGEGLCAGTGLLWRRMGRESAGPRSGSRGAAPRGVLAARRRPRDDRDRIPSMGLQVVCPGAR